MTTGKEELQQLYNTKIKGQLQLLEQLRKKVLWLFVGGIALVLLSFSSFWTTIVTDEPPGTINYIIFGLLIIPGIVVFYKAIKNKGIYRTKFKTDVVLEIVHAINPDWNYDPKACISQGTYRESDLFRQHCDRYRGEDLVFGKIDKTEFQCSELHTQYKSVTTDSKGNTREHWHTIFRGLFFHAEFNKHLNGRTYVSPDVAERLLGRLGTKLQKISGKAKLVKLENPEFEKLFVVHSSDQIEARYVLTPKIMEAIVKIYKRYGSQMHLSFIGSKVYCAISMHKDLFEPRVMRSGVNFSDIAFIYYYLAMNKTIIQELNLNTRIWTKE